jgi:hypothetical protein
MLDKLVDIGQEEMLYVHFEAWLYHFTKPASPEVKPEERKPRELTPEEIGIKANPRAFLPRVSGLIDRELYQKFVHILWALDPKHADETCSQSGRIGELRLKHDTYTIEIFDPRSGIGRFYVCSDQIDKRWTPEYWLQVWSEIRSYRLVNKLVAGRIAPQYIPEAIEEVEAELQYVRKIGSTYIRPALKGKDRTAVTRFREWMAKQQVM